VDAAGDRRALVCRLVRERGQCHELALADQARTGEPAEREPQPHRLVIELHVFGGLTAAEVSR
jgi:hypothetical protein